MIVRSLHAVLAGGAAGMMVSIAVDAGMVRLLPELGSGQWSFRVAAALLMLAAGAAAATVAARYAAAIEPIQALRGD
jgi:ABC-type antimicrobial peptide transport system permease subunit